MSRPSRFILAAVLVLLAWMVLSGWETDTPKARVFSAVFAAFMLILALGLAAPSRFGIAFRIVAGVVAVAYTWYFVSEVLALLRGANQPLRMGQPSALMAGIGLLIFGVPALVFALSGVNTGWVARLLRRARGEQEVDDRDV